MIEVKRYTDADADLWNMFNAESKNPLFMFDRNYMDYHRDRFQDHSLMFYEAEKLIALLPMSEHSNMLVSHGGLTYGGFITDTKMKQHTMMECFVQLIEYARKNAVHSIRYKCIPHIYHNHLEVPLFCNGACTDPNVPYSQNPLSGPASAGDCNKRPQSPAPYPPETPSDLSQCYQSCAQNQ